MLILWYRCYMDACVRTSTNTVREDTFTVGTVATACTSLQIGTVRYRTILYRTSLLGQLLMYITCIQIRHNT